MELMVGLVILAILLAIAVPSMREFIARKRVEGVARELATDLRYLKAQQVQRGTAVTIQFRTAGATTCYTLATIGGTGEQCDCTLAAGQICGDPNALNPNIEIKTVVLPRSAGVEITSTPASMDLTGLNGRPDTTLRVSIGSSVGGQVRVDTNLLASPTMCSVSGHESTIPRCSP